MTVDGPIPAGVTDATNIFNGNMTGVSGYTLTQHDHRAGHQDRLNGTVTATFTFTANVPATFHEA